jgi:protein phosphatase
MTLSDDRHAELLSGFDRWMSYFAPNPPVVRVEFGARSHPGKVRTRNEDQWLVVRRRRTRDVLMTSLPQSWLPTIEEYAYTIAVADGMGGGQFGDLASLLALHAGWELGFNDVKWHVKISETEVEEILERFEAYCQLIHKSLLKDIELEPKLEGIGTTLTTAYTVGLDAFITNVGDSRAYVFHDGSLSQLTRDHTLAQRFVDAGVYAPESVEARRLRHVLTSCLGATKGNIRVDVAHATLDYGDTLLLCTDGLTDLVSDEQISVVLGENEDPVQACNVLLEMALDAGGTDNVTVLVAQFRKPLSVTNGGTDGTDSATGG